MTEVVQEKKDVNPWEVKRTTIHAVDETKGAWALRESFGWAAPALTVVADVGVYRGMVFYFGISEKDPEAGGVMWATEKYREWPPADPWAREIIIRALAPAVMRYSATAQAKHFSSMKRIVDEGTLREIETRRKLRERQGWSNAVPSYGVPSPGGV